MTVYGKVVRQFVSSPDHRSVFAELIEFGGREGDSRRENAAVYAFDLDDRGFIKRMAIYQMPVVPGEPDR